MLRRRSGKDRFWIRAAAGAARAVSLALFPGTCLCCGTFVDARADQSESGKTRHISGTEPYRFSGEEIFAAAAADKLCPACLHAFVPVKSPYCLRCGLSFRSRAGDNHLCGRCLAGEKPFVFARSCGAYTTTLQTLIHTYKYRGKTGIGHLLGDLLYRNFLKHFGNEPVERVVPVPLHRKKLVSRGFDQVFHMVDQWPWKKRYGCRKTPTGAMLAANALVRTKHTDSQTGLDRKKRAVNMKSAFAVSEASMIEGRAVLLIDDVYTTGATLEACADTLLRAGAAKVYFLTLARAM